MESLLSINNRISAKQIDVPSISGMGESFGGLFTICGAATKNPSSSSSVGEGAS